MGGEGSGGAVMEAYLARPAGIGTWPAVLVGFEFAGGHIAYYAATQVPLAALVAADAWHRAMELLATERGPES